LERKDSFDYTEQKHDNNDDDDRDLPVRITPEPASIGLLGSRLVRLGGILPTWAAVVIFEDQLATMAQSS